MTTLAALLLLLDSVVLVCLALGMRWTAGLLLGGGSAASVATLGRAAAVVRSAWVLALGAGLVFAVGVAEVLPSTVSGARCGQGVLEATGDSGLRAGLLRALSCGALFASQIFLRIRPAGHDAVSAGGPEAAGARSLWIAAGLVPMASYATVVAGLRLEDAAPVSCCAAVYEAVETDAGMVLPDSFWWVGAGLASLSVLVGSWRSRRPTRSGAWLLGLGGPLLAVFGAVAAARIPGAGSDAPSALGDVCVYCLFLERFDFVGYVMLPAAALLGLAGPVAGLLQRVCRAGDAAVIGAPTLRRLRGASLVGLVLYAVVFAVLAFRAPASFSG